MIGRSAAKQQFEIDLPTVNLLSPSVFEAMAVRTLQRRFVAAAVALVLLVAGGWVVQHLRAEQAAKLLVVEEGETARLTAKAEDLAPVSTYVATVANQKILVSRTMATEALLSSVLDDLAVATPEGVRVETLTAVVTATTIQTDQSASTGQGQPGQPGQNGETACPAPDPFKRSTTVGCVTMTGTASTRAAIGRLVDRLGSGVFVAPYITTTANADGTKLTFTGSVGVNSRVYSKRYADLDELLASRAGRDDR